MGMSVEMNDYTEVPKGKEEEKSIEALGKQPVDPKTRAYLGYIQHWAINEERNTDKLFTSEYSTNDADLRFKERLKDADLGFEERLRQVEDEQNKI